MTKNNYHYFFSLLVPWIDVIHQNEAIGRLNQLYKAVKTPEGHVDNILKIHSLRPRTLHAHLVLYKATLHSKPNGMSPRERELIAVGVSQLNECIYCVEHHRAGLANHVGDRDLALELSLAVVKKIESSKLTNRERVMGDYAIKLTKTPHLMREEDILILKENDLDDVTILDLNQLVAYFAYANRTVNGLGVDIAGEVLGLHPDENRDDFGHS